MAFHGNVELAGGTPTLLTSSDITSITLHNKTPGPIFVWFTAGATSPTDRSLALEMDKGTAILNATMADLAPGVSGANRVYAESETGGIVFVSHA